MKPIPSNAQIQNLIASHPHGVKGPPLAIAWSTHRPDTLVIIDTLGHKLIFENPSAVVNPATPTSDNIGLSTSPAPKPPSKPVDTGQQSPNKKNLVDPKPPIKPVDTGRQSPNKKEPGSPKPPNKPKP